MKVNNAKGQLTYQIEIDKQQKNGFPIDCDFMTTGKMGCIYPTQALPVTYGDKINNLSSAALQFQPLAVPMLANMFVKQEHYYTPRNCVWQNWDNFISGGEDLQFTTPPPSTNMRQLITMVLLQILGNVFSFGVYGRRKNYATTGSLYYYRFELPIFPGQSYFLNSIVENAKEQIKSLAVNYGIVDIIDNYVIKVLDDMIADLWTDKEYNVNNPENFVLFKTKYSTGVVDDAIADGYVAPQSYVIPEDWQYSIDLVKLLVRSGKLVLDNPSIVDSFVPTEYGYKLLTYMYKLIRPFIGVGSYIDCLNMNRVLPADFYYLCNIAFLNVFNSSVFVDDSSTTSDVVQLNIMEAVSTYTSDLPMDCLNLRTQYLIWYNNYRDQLLEIDAPKPVNLDYVSVGELISLIVPRHRCWEKDSYTTALDNPATADAVVPTYNERTHKVLTMQSYEVQGAGDQEIYRNDGTIHEIKFADGEKFRIPTGFISGLTDVEDSDSNTTKYYFSLNMLDAVKRAQKFLRKALFYGNRIQDFVLSTWGVSHLDARLRLPEILSTSTDMVQLTTLVNNTTVATDQSSTVAGDRAGYANGYDKGNGFSRYCEEAGVIMSFLTVMPQPTYPYGSDRQYYKMDRYDYPIPDFATLGMDAVFDSEIVSCPNKTLVNGQLTSMPLVFGYQGRYYDSKFRQSTEHGELLTTQDMYTFGRKWNMYKEDGRPKLNYEFVHCFPVTDMFVMDDNTEDIFRADVHHETTAELTLPYHSIYL